MIETIHIEKISQHRLSLALHAFFHGDVCSRMINEDPDKIGVPKSQSEEYKKWVDEELDMIAEARESYNTREIQKKDSECDRLLSFIFSMVRTMRLSPKPEEVESAEKLYIIMRVGKRIQAEGVTRKPARIESLLIDLKKPECTEHISRLRLEEGIELLEKSYKELRTLVAERTNERAEKKRPSATQIRPKTDKAYYEILRLLEVAYIQGQAPVDRESIENLVRYLNEHTNNVRMVHRQSQAQRKSRSNQKEESEEVSD